MVLGSWFLVLLGGLGGGDIVLTAPVPSIRGTEKPVLDEDDCKVPQDDLPSKDRLVERWHLAGSLAVVVGQTHEEKYSDCPEEHSDG